MGSLTADAAVITEESDAGEFTLCTQEEAVGEEGTDDVTAPPTDDAAAASPPGNEGTMCAVLTNT